MDEDAQSGSVMSISMNSSIEQDIVASTANVSADLPLEDVVENPLSQIYLKKQKKILDKNEKKRKRWKKNKKSAQIETIRLSSSDEEEKDEVVFVPLPPEPVFTVDDSDEDVIECGNKTLNINEDDSFVKPPSNSVEKRFETSSCCTSPSSIISYDDFIAPNDRQRVKKIVTPDEIFFPGIEDSLSEAPSIFSKENLSNDKSTNEANAEQKDDDSRAEAEVSISEVVCSDTAKVLNIYDSDSDRSLGIIEKVKGKDVNAVSLSGSNNEIVENPLAKKKNKKLMKQRRASESRKSLETSKHNTDDEVTNLSENVEKTPASKSMERRKSKSSGKSTPEKSLNTSEDNSFFAKLRLLAEGNNDDDTSHNEEMPGMEVDSIFEKVNSNKTPANEDSTHETFDLAENSDSNDEGFVDKIQIINVEYVEYVSSQEMQNSCPSRTEQTKSYERDVADEETEAFEASVIKDALPFLDSLENVIGAVDGNLGEKTIVEISDEEDNKQSDNEEDMPSPPPPPSFPTKEKSEAEKKQDDNLPCTSSSLKIKTNLQEKKTSVVSKSGNIAFISKSNTGQYSKIVCYEVPVDDVEAQHGLGWPEEQKRFYTHSWNGEKFDMNKLLSKMNSNQNLWRINTKDQHQVPMRMKDQKLKCFNCNGFGHKRNDCPFPQKPKVCKICGDRGHTEESCPRKCCLGCGAKTNSFVKICNACAFQSRERCSICRFIGHNATNCPDTWRRYHSTVKNVASLKSINKYQPRLFCSNCGREGHVVEFCKRQRPPPNYPVVSSRISSYERSYKPTPIATKQKSLLCNLMYTPRVTEVTKSMMSPSKKSPLYSRIINEIGLTHLLRPKRQNESAESSQDMKRTKAIESDNNNQGQQQIATKTTTTTNKNSKIFRNESATQGQQQPKTTNKNSKQQKTLEDNGSPAAPKESNTTTDAPNVNDANDNEIPEAPLPPYISPLMTSFSTKKSAAVDIKKENEELPSTSKKSIEDSSISNIAVDSDSNYSFSDHFDTTAPENDTSNLNDSNEEQDPSAAPDFIPIESTDDDEAPPPAPAIQSSKIVLTTQHATFLSKGDGQQNLQQICRETQITTQINWSPAGPILQLEGPACNHEIFQNSLMIELKKYSDQSNNDKTDNMTLLPKKVGPLVRFLREELSCLKRRLGNPLALYQQLQSFDKQIQHSKNATKKINQLRRSLNMILIGQAGLENGKSHLESILVSLKELVFNFPQESKVPVNVRDGIYLHWKTMFSCQPYMNYEKLVEIYNKLEIKNQYLMVKTDPVVLGERTLNTSLSQQQLERLSLDNQNSQNNASSGQNQNPQNNNSSNSATGGSSMQAPRQTNYVPPQNFQASNNNNNKNNNNNSFNNRSSIENVQNNSNNSSRSQRYFNNNLNQQNQNNNNQQRPLRMQSNNSNNNNNNNSNNNNNNSFNNNNNFNSQNFNNQNQNQSFQQRNFQNFHQNQLQSMNNSNNNNFNNNNNNRNNNNNSNLNQNNQYQQQQQLNMQNLLNQQQQLTQQQNQSLQNQQLRLLSGLMNATINQNRNQQYQQNQNCNFMQSSPASSLAIAASPSSSSSSSIQLNTFNDPGSIQRKKFKTSNDFLPPFMKPEQRSNIALNIFDATRNWERSCISIFAEMEKSAGTSNKLPSVHWSRESIVYLEKLIRMVGFNPTLQNSLRRFLAKARDNQLNVDNFMSIKKIFITSQNNRQL